MHPFWGYGCWSYYKMVEIKSDLLLAECAKNETDASSGVFMWLHMLRLQ